MKQFIFFIVLFMIMGCANNSYKSLEPEVNSIKTEGLYEEKETSFAALENAYSILISEKLQDHLDQQALAKQHPKFKIEDDALELFSSKNVKEIQQIKFIGQPQVISDSITKIITQVYFSNTKTDTVISYIKTSTTIIDGVKFKTSKATFEKVESTKKAN